MLLENTNKIRVRWALSLFFFCQGLVFASWASRIPYIKSLLDISEGTLGTILLMMPTGQILTMTLSGRVVTKYGSEKIIPIASIVYAMVLVSIAFITDIYMLGICLFLLGVWSNLGNIAVNTQAIAVENLYQRTIMSSFHGAWSLAGFVGALIALLSIQLELNIWQHFLIILSIIILNAVFNSHALIKDVEVKETKKGLIKPDGVIIQLGIICFLVMATEGAMFDWSGVYFKEVVEAPEKWVPVGYTAFMITMASGRFIGDYVISKIGRKMTLQISGIMMSLGLFISVLFPEMLICTLAFMLVGFGVATVVPTVYSLASQHEKIPPGKAIALVSSISFFGFLIGPPLIGYIAEWSSLKYSYSLFGLFGIVLLILVRRLNIFK